MRRTVVVLALLAVCVAMLGVTPAPATHGCTTPSCNPVAISLIEGHGLVCGVSTGGSPCVYHKDALWSGPITGVKDGLYCPTRGPGAGKTTGSPGTWLKTGSHFSFTAGPGITPPGTVCVSNVGGNQCAFVSYGELGPGDHAGLGAYAGSSQGEGFSTFTAPPTPFSAGTTVNATFGWEQSAATILPLRGSVISSTPAGGAGATVVGFTSSRSFQNGGNCGIDPAQPTTDFQVEGMVVTF